MKKNYIAIALALAAGVPAGFAYSKFDAAGNMVVDQYKAMIENPGAKFAPLSSLPFNLDVRARGDVEATLFLTLNPGYDSSDLEAYGLEVLTTVDDIAIVRGSMDDVLAAVESDAVKAAEFDRQVRPQLDHAREATGMDKVQAGTGLPNGFDGTGVIAGIYDTGLDPNHPNFKKDGKTRLAALWHFGQTNGTSTAYLTPKDIEGFTTDNSAQTHATHVLGCMAGSYNGVGVMAELAWNGGVGLVNDKPLPFYGMAPGSTIVAGCGGLYDSNITRGVQNILEYAAEKDMPAVVNLSLGLFTGPSDGTDAFSRTLTRFAQQGIICVAAGNDGDLRSSIMKDFTAGNTEMKSFPIMTNPASRNRNQGSVTIWSYDQTPVTTKFVIYDANTSAVIYSLEVDGTSEQSITLSTSELSGTHDAAFDRAFAPGSTVRISRSFNTASGGRYNCVAQYDLTNNGTSNASGLLSFGVIVQGEAGKRAIMSVTGGTELYPNAFSDRNAAGWDDGTNDYTLSYMAAAKDIISVGSWNTREAWGVTQPLGVSGYYTSGKYPAVDINEGYWENEISGFSSCGVTLDGRSCPIIAAPGCGIISSVSSFANISGQSAQLTENGRTYKWQAQQGTSMACPVTAGTIAAWLQANPDLTSQQAIDIIKKTATVDEYVEETGNPIQWGAGKLNSYEGIKEALILAGIKDVTVGNDKNDVLVQPVGDRRWEIFAAGANEVNVEVYNLAGSRVASISANGDTAVFDAEGLAAGIYLLRANGGKAERIIVK